MELEKIVKNYPHDIKQLREIVIKDQPGMYSSEGGIINNIQSKPTHKESLLDSLFNIKEFLNKSESKYVKNDEKSNDSDDSEDFNAYYQMQVND